MLLLLRLILISTFVDPLSPSDLFVFYSELTPESIRSEFTSFENQMLINKNSDSIKITETVDFTRFSILLDLTVSQNYFFTLDCICEAFGLAYITITLPDPITLSDFRFHVRNSKIQETNAILVLIKYLNINNLAILTSSSHELINLSDALKNTLPSHEITLISYSQEINQNESNTMIKNMIKVKGLRKILILDNGNSLEKIQKSIKALKLDRKGSVFIFFTRIPKMINIDGSLVLCQKDTEISASNSNFYLVSVLKALSEIESFSYVSPQDILRYLNSQYKEHTFFSDYSIINIQNSEIHIVGTIGNTVEIVDNIIFPGKQLNIDFQDSSTIVTISIANGTSEIYNAGSYSGFSYLYEAARYAVYRSNALNEFPNFKFELLNTDCGIFAYDPTWYKMCFTPAINNLGIAYLTSLWSDSALGNLLTLRELGVKIPQISALSQDDTLNNKIEYPEFFKITLSTKDQMSSSIFLARTFEWYDFNIFVTEDYMYMYYEVLGFIKEIGISFINPELMRTLPTNYTREDFPKYRSYFEAAKNTGSRIFVIMATTASQFIIEGLYDIGLRKGDFVTFGGGDIYRFLIEEKNENYLKKLRELLPGSFVYGYLEWSGKFGQTLKSEMQNIFPQISYMCMVYDSFLAIKNTFSFMLQKGLDYEDPEAFIAALRNTNGQGCLGTLNFNRQSNSKGSAKFLFQQILNNETSNEFYLKDVIVIDKYSADSIIKVSEIDWQNFDNVIPKNYKLKPVCPFDDYLIRRVYKSRIIFYVFSGFFLLLTALCGFLSSKNNDFKLPQIKNNTQISLSDYVFISYFAIQFFQYLTLGPDQTTYKYIVNNFQILISLDFNLYFSIGFSIFWLLFYIVLCVSYIWIFLCLIAIFKIDKRYQTNFFISKIAIGCDIIIPLVGHIGFIPMISMLFNIYQCNEGIGDNLTESFLDLDCMTFCYEGFHLRMMIATTISLALCISLAVFYRSNWEVRQSSLNINTKPKYLAVMSFAQLLMIIVTKILKFEYEMEAGIVNSAIIVCFIIVTVLMKPYNYTRVHIMQLMSLGLSFWGIFTAAVIGKLLSFSIWFAAEFIGFFFILIGGAIIMSRYPKLFYSEELNIIPHLFRFQFNLKKEKYIYDDESVDLGVEKNRFNSIETLLNK